MMVINFCFILFIFQTLTYTHIRARARTYTHIHTNTHTPLSLSLSIQEQYILFRNTLNATGSTSEIIRSEECIRLPSKRKPGKEWERKI